MATSSPKSLRYAFHTYAVLASLLALSDFMLFLVPGLVSVTHKSQVREASSGPAVSLRSSGPSIPESLFLSKAFSDTLQPSNVTPYYFRASNAIRKDDVTVTTQITENRFQVFKRLVESYQGPISVTVHVTSSSPTSAQTLEALQELYTSSSDMRRWVDVHLVMDPFERQFNYWRNVARFFSRTDYVMMLDVDFAVSTNVRATIAGDAGRLMREGGVAMVVPAFEYTKQENGMDVESFPKNKETLLNLVRDGEIGMFHRSWEPGHSSTNYSRYYATPPGGSVYKVTAYQHSYEPYVIMPKEGVPWCDERFVGYGANKAACLYELYMSGMQYYVLPDDFVVHQSHAYAEETRKNEASLSANNRKFNRKLYAEYREETCLRYLSQFSSAEPDDVVASNARSQCERVLRAVNRRVATPVQDPSAP